jgi:hypothetical protein
VHHLRTRVVGRAPSAQTRVLQALQDMQEVPRASSEGTCYHCFAIADMIDECPECAGKIWREEFLEAEDEIEGPDKLLVRFSAGCAVVRSSQFCHTRRADSSPLERFGMTSSAGTCTGADAAAHLITSRSVWFPPPDRNGDRGSVTGGRAGGKALRSRRRWLEWACLFALIRG